MYRQTKSVFMHWRTFWSSTQHTNSGLSQPPKPHNHATKKQTKRSVNKIVDWQHYTALRFITRIMIHYYVISEQKFPPVW